MDEGCLESSGAPSLLILFLMGSQCGDELGVNYGMMTWESINWKKRLKCDSLTYICTLLNCIPLGPTFDISLPTPRM